MTTIISTPTPSTTIVSSVTVDTPHPVDSIFGRSGDVVAVVNDYDITEIRAGGATDGDSIVLEGGQCVIKTPQIANVAIQTGALAAGDVIQFNGTNWTNVTLSGIIDSTLGVHILETNGVHGLIDTGGGTLFLADDGNYKTITHPAAPVSSVFGRGGVVIAAVGDYAIADITGLITVGPGTNFLSDDGTYKTTPTAPVSSVFGRTGLVVAANNDYTLAQISGLTDVGPGTNFLANDGTYKAITHPSAPVTSIFGRTGIVTAANNDYALAEINGLIDAGGGALFLADDGVYKETPSATPKDIISPSVADGTTITNAFQTIFDFSPDATFRNNNCLLTIYYQAMNIGGPGTWGAHFRSLIGFTVQQNGYASGVAQTVDSSQRATFTFTMEGIVSATGNIQIQAFAAIRDHDIGNSATNGKTRLTIELV